jgi:hypothetical protein
MEDQDMYKDNFLIPIMRKRISELSALALELEATVIFQNNKIKELNDKILSLNIINGEEAPSQPKSKKKQAVSSDGGTF